MKWIFKIFGMCNCRNVTVLKGDKGDTGATGPQGPAGTMGYKVYSALLTQTGLSAPVATLMENTIGGTPSWSRDDVGSYYLTITGEFTVGKTFILINNTSVDLHSFTISSSVNTVNNIWVLTRNGAVVSDSVLTNTCIEVRVYP